MWDKLKSSRKFWASVIGVVTAVAKGAGVEIPGEVLQMIMVYVVGQGVADIGNGKPQ